MNLERENITIKHKIANWKPEDAQAIFRALEEPNWASWLAASKETLAGRAEVFSDGHLVIMSVDGIPLASLSMNRIDWNGDIDSLPSWDTVAGEPTTYENTYKEDGNTLVMMSMNVHPDYQGEGFARKLIDQAKIVAEKLGVDYLLGSFRPNEYGKYKLKGKDQGFKQYCFTIREDGWPVDAWLRNLSRNGMKPLIIDPNGMVVKVNLEEFISLKNDQWIEISPNTWECGEVGAWVVDLNLKIATYQESNLWGLIWEKTGSQ